MVSISNWTTWVRHIVLCAAMCAVLLFAIGGKAHAAGAKPTGSQPHGPYIGQCQYTHWTNKQNVSIDMYNGQSHYTGTLSIYGLYDNYFGGEFCSKAYVKATLQAAIGSRDTTIQAEMSTDSGTYYGSAQTVSGITGTAVTSTTPAEYMVTATGIDLIGGTADKSTYTWGTSTHPW